jgi:hypothetical protein
MKALSRIVSSSLAGLVALASCHSGEPVEQETASGGRIANEGGRDTSEGGRTGTTGGVAGRSSGGSRPASSGGSSGADRPGGESGDPGGSAGDDPSAGESGAVDPDGGSAGASGAMDPDGGSANGGAPTGGTPSGGAPTGGAGPTGGFPAFEGCDSGRLWDPAGSDGFAPEGPWMNPGRMCIRCHEEQTGGSVVEIGGTVYPSFNEQDLCYGVDGVSLNAEVVVTDSEGEVFRLPVGPTGNFSLLLEGAPRVELPISAKLVVGDRERVMTYTPNVADCNYCHTKEGVNGAPGRIVLP